MGRVLKYDGLIPVIMGPDGTHEEEILPGKIREMKEFVEKNRIVRGRMRRDFDIIKDGTTPANEKKAKEIVVPYAEAGATWWTETMWGVKRIGDVRKRIQAGPPTR
jgi:fructose-1-phosphate kinase PfkB-like protein